MAKQEFKVIGKSVPIMEARERVLGICKYVDDMVAELHVKILRSPYPHAMIKNIDTSKAEKLEGVAAVLTHKDVPHRLMYQACLAPCYILDDHVRYVGDEVAAVAAKSKAIAEEALDLIEVEYEPLPAVFDPEEAAKEDAPKLYSDGNVYGPAYLAHGIEKRTHEPTLLEWGDINKGFEEADVVVEDKFEVGPQQHSPLEPHVCMASWEGEELTLWNSTQTPTEVREGIANVLEIPLSRVRVISKNVGGGFGSKFLTRYQPITALLSKKAGGKLTKLVFTREEDLIHLKRCAFKIYMKIGARKDGTITAILFRGYADLGGYGYTEGGFASFYAETPCSAYKAENARWEGWDVSTNHFSSQSYRAVQLPGMSFAIEQVIDEVAEKLGMDPVEFRLKNMPETGDMIPFKPIVGDNILGFERGKLDTYPSKRIMQEVKEKIDWGRWKGWGKPIATDGPKRRGIGIAYSIGWSGYEFIGGLTMAVAINRDGSVNIISGTQDLGTGSNTTLRMLAAEFLGISLEDVTISAGDTITGMWDYLGARASTELASGGHVLLNAIEDAKQKIREMAAPRLKVKPGEVEVRGKKAYVKNKKERSIPLVGFITTSIVGSAAGPPSVSGPKIRNALVQAAEVEVDIETGEVKPIRIVTGNCPGRMINPGIVKGQYVGGAIQSLGMALWEAFNYDEENSVYLSSNLTDYRVPRALDAPHVENVIVEESVERAPHVGLPYGAMGVGELSCWGGPPSIANAIYNAIGVRIKQCPMTAERIFEALGKEG